ncbi:MAG: sigma-54-dependent Fis family transcriptional regulator [Candidatus Eisenbacteria bacterium]|uniref:Sigma-54-dependent Fis family transcriptional regulator n=1 Tax=Eiseniibacteriota bacterium TaxID=2212470 RepID=A0A933SCG7_UNCEI|nr:sigma-54-dependent Fis family transcriptional regulator [Candidatus Eisenbacteria bacterium]
MKVLVVDDEVKNAELVAAELADAGFTTEYANGGAAALKRLEAERFDAVVTDLRMAPPDGMALLGQVRERWPATAVIVMTAYAALETARKALKLGARDYVEKEGDFTDVLVLSLRELAEKSQLAHENERLAASFDSLRREALPVVGEAPATKRVLDMAARVAVTDSTVLLRGESGSGKDLFARTIHLLSRRAGGPWVKVNCGALPEALLESELFGHEKGAFTGAVRQKAGRFEDAHRGTIFLDEIGEMPVSLQVKLLQVIEEKTFTRVGGNQPITVDVRILAATNRPLEDMVRERTFREDLFFRLNVFPLVLPPLRERPGDVPRLVQHFLRKHGAAEDKIDGAALRAMSSYAFPGHVRELEHVVVRALILAGPDPSGVEHLTFAATGSTNAGAGGTFGPAGWVPEIPEEGLSLEDLERELILKALERAKGNKSRAARLLGLTRRTLYSRMEKHGLRRPGEGGDGGDDDPEDAGE